MDLEQLLQLTRERGGNEWHVYAACKRLDRIGCLPAGVFARVVLAALMPRVPLSAIREGIAEYRASEWPRAYEAERRASA